MKKVITKKVITMVLLLACLWALVGCSPAENDNTPAPGEETEQKTPITEENRTSQTDIVLTEAPALTVVCGEESIEALKGTTSWRYQNEDGTETGIDGDSPHPLQAKEYMTALELAPASDSSAEPLYKANLQWETSPDKVSVRYWDEECWEDYEAASTELPVEALETETADGSYSRDFLIELPEGNYIYEVIAEWSSAEKYSGTVCYSFYTEDQR